MLKSKFILTLSESKNSLALDQKAIILSFVKNVAFLLGHPVVLTRQKESYLNGVGVPSPLNRKSKKNEDGEWGR